jgi:hypothetical protein
LALLEKNQTAPTKVSQEISEQFDEALTLQFLSATYTNMYEERKEKVVQLIVDDPNVSMQVGTGFPVNDHGQIVPMDRSFYTWNPEKMYEQVKLKKVRVEDFIACINGFDIEKVRAVFGGSVENFAAARKTRSFQFRAKPTFKLELKELFFGEKKAKKSAVHRDEALKIKI